MQARRDGYRCGRRAQILIQLIDLADNGVALDAIVTLRKVSLRLLPSRAYIAKVLESNGVARVAAEIYKTAITEKFEKKTSRLYAIFCRVDQAFSERVSLFFQRARSLCDLGDSARAQFLVKNLYSCSSNILASKETRRYLPRMKSIRCAKPPSRLKQKLKIKVDVWIFVKCVRTFLAIKDASKAFRFRKAKTAIENANETQKNESHTKSENCSRAARSAKALDIHELSKKKTTEKMVRR